MKKFYSEALAVLIIFLILVSSTVSAATTKNIQPPITETRLTTDGSEAGDPAIYDDKIVWANENEIHLYNLKIGKDVKILMPPNCSGPNNPVIYNNKIAWHLFDTWVGGDGIPRLCVYDIPTSASSLFTENVSYFGDPAIYGNRIVWEYDNVDGSSDIYMCDISTHVQTHITTSGTAFHPSTYGNRIVWEDHRNGNGKSDIYMYDLSTSKETRVTSDGISYGPKIYENKIVWCRLINGDQNSDIYMYDLSASKEIRITTSGYASQPYIQGNRIVYEDSRNQGNHGIGDNGIGDIYMYDLSVSKEIRITTSGYASEPAIYGNIIVDADARNGLPRGDAFRDIYIYDLPDTAVVPTANFSANVLSGLAPLVVAFTDQSTGVPTSWYWDFGDRTSSIDPNPIHTYGAGNYTVNLIVSNANGTDSKLGTINVSKSTSILTWDNPASITYGTALSGTQLNAVASVPGIYVYTPVAGTVLNVGTKTLHIDFTPTDTTNYTTASKDVTINVMNVQKTTPKITWNNPADMAYGTKLSSTQLNAVASVPGSFVYTPAAGTKLPVGAQTLKVTFTPKDATKYATATKTVTVNVLTVPLADFSASTASGKAPLPVTFTDKSTGSPSTWTWKFGDGGSLTSKIPYVPVHTYTKKGKYTVSLTVKNVAGSSTKTMSITVK